MYGRIYRSMRLIRSLFVFLYERKLCRNNLFALSLVLAIPRAGKEDRGSVRVSSVQREVVVANCRGESLGIASDSPSKWLQRMFLCCTRLASNPLIPKQTVSQTTTGRSFNNPLILRQMPVAPSAKCQTT